MTEDFKDYLGAIEISINGFQYEIGLRKEGDRGIRGIWTCVACMQIAPTNELKASEGDAIELAKAELEVHHNGHHRAQCDNSPR